jgi:GT2 family glycosyltransferase
MKISFSVIVVLYNVKLLESTSVKEVYRQAEVFNNNNIKIEVYVCDNSTRYMGNRSQANQLGIHYLDMGRNVGLAKAFNYAINVVSGSYITIFDDDSILDGEYFNKMLKVIQSNPNTDIFLPEVFALGKKISPSREVGCFVRQFPRCFGHITGISSGMTIRRNVFKKIKYDEKMFLDFIDYDFIKASKNSGFKIIEVNNIKISQKFSVFEDDPKDSVNRFEIMLKDLLYFSKKYAYIRSGLLSIFLLAIKRTIRYRNKSFLRMSLQVIYGQYSNLHRSR